MSRPDSAAAAPCCRPCQSLPQFLFHQFHGPAPRQTATLRAGVLHTPHGDVATPTFMAVGTQGALKGISFAQAKDAGANIVLGNTYHLALRPGPELIHKLGGLHGFTGWDQPMLTDSGGYQVFSLAERVALMKAAFAFSRIWTGLNST